MKIVKIKINKKKLERLKGKITREHWNYLVKKYGDGWCSKCENYATYKVVEDVSDSDIKASRITRYCDSHWSKELRK